VAVLCLAVVLTGCRLDLAAESEVEADGSGEAALQATFDPELLDELDALGVDPTAELEATAAVTDGWEVTRTLEEDGSLTVRLAHEVDAASQIGDAYRELAAGLGELDPGLLVDVEVEVDDEGAGSVEGTVELRSPGNPGVTVDGEPVGLTDDELDGLVERAVDTEVAVTLPGAVERSDGDEVDGSTVRWHLDPDQPRAIEAVSRAPRWWESVPLLAVAGGGSAVVLLAGLGGWWWRRRRAGRRAVRPAV
jgi:hypothetical protein